MTPSTPTPNDCFALPDTSGLDRGSLEDFLAVEQAWELIARQVPAIAGQEAIDVAQALGRVLALSVVSTRQVPAQANAAVDGYAFRQQENFGQALAVAQVVHAGDAPPPDLLPGQAARVLTGAFLPANADTVAMEEDCEVEGETVRLPTLKQGANRRPAGENVELGEIVMQGGQVLRAQELALALTAGQPVVSVKRRLRVALFSTGNELAVDQADEHQTVDSNAPMLAALLSGPSVQVTWAGVLPDDADSVMAALEKAGASHDLIVTTGGASMSEADHMRRTLVAHGSAHIWRLAIKPGRPLLLGSFQGCPVAALPGNPVAAYVTGLLIVLPIIRALLGVSPVMPPPVWVTAGFSRTSKQGRAEFLRVALDSAGNASVFPRDGAGIIPSLSFADGLAWVGQEQTAVSEGDFLRYFDFARLGSL